MRSPRAIIIASRYTRAPSLSLHPPVRFCLYFIISAFRASYRGGCQERGEQRDTRTRSLAVTQRGNPARSVLSRCSPRFSQRARRVRCPSVARPSLLYILIDDRRPAAIRADDFARRDSLARDSATSASRTRLPRFTVAVTREVAREC